MLGDLPVNEVAREMIGAIILRVKEAGRSLAIIEGIRNPLRGYFAELIETKVLPGPNPAADLKFFVGKRADKKRLRTLMFCSQEGDSHGWGFGLSIVTRRDSVAGPVGKFGWDGGLGTSWYSDPREDVVTILMTQRAWTSPNPPNVCLDFWTAAYQAIDDSGAQGR